MAEGTGGAATRVPPGRPASQPAGRPPGAGPGARGVLDRAPGEEGGVGGVELPSARREAGTACPASPAPRRPPRRKPSPVSPPSYWGQRAADGRPRLQLPPPPHAWSRPAETFVPRAPPSAEVFFPRRCHGAGGAAAAGRAPGAAGRLRGRRAGGLAGRARPPPLPAVAQAPAAAAPGGRAGAAGAGLSAPCVDGSGRQMNINGFILRLSLN